MKQKQTNKLFKYIFRLAVVSVAGIAILLSSACAGDDKSGVSVINDVSVRNQISAEVKDKKLHYCRARESLELVGASGLLELYVDPVTNSFAVFEISKDCMWSALPIIVSAASLLTSKASEAAVVSLKVAVKNGDVFYLNSQDNSVAYGKAKYSITDSGVELTYDIFADETSSKAEMIEAKTESVSAKKSNKSVETTTEEPKVTDKDIIAFRVTVSAQLIDGSLFVGCDYYNLSDNPDAYIQDITLLNYFGAYGESFEDDFVLVPDGCGAIIKTAINDDSFESLSFPVYGQDPSLDSDEQLSGDAVLGAFGIKHGENAFVALVESGAAVSTIKADKAVDVGEFNTVCASFNVTPVFYSGDKLYISDSSFHSEEPGKKPISMCYRFVSGKNATYGGLASACREQLIRNSTLSTSYITDTAALPFNLSVTGAVQSSLVGNFGYLNKLTDLDDALDMLVRLKSKGVNNINMRIAGAFSGGINSKEIRSSSLLRRLGGSDSLTKLYEYTYAQKMGLYLDINMLTSSSGFSAAHSTAKNIYHEDSSTQLINPMGLSIGDASYTRSLRNLSNIGKVVSSVLSSTRYYSFSGYCLDDVGSILYSDFSYSGMNREKAASAIAGTISPLATNRTTMAVKGNFYMLRNINVVVDMPLKTAVSQSGAYLSVPFIQIILHGILDYSGEPINASVNYEETLLRCIEYGACPYYSWNYTPVMDDADKDIYYWDNSINEAVELYTTVNEVLGDLRGARITDHYEVDDGVFCTEYDNGAMIYVNYTSSDYQTLGAVVNARSYIRIN